MGSAGVRFGIEDFPLDVCELDGHRSYLDPLVASGRYGILLDVGHLNLSLAGAAAPISRAIRTRIGGIPLSIIELHVHDNRGQRDDHAYLGYGEIPFVDVVQALRERGFDGVATFEVVPPYYGSTLEEGLEQVRDSLLRWRELWEIDAGGGTVR